VDPGERCPTTTTIADFLGRQLDVTAIANVESHLADCAACRGVVGTLASGSVHRMAGEAAHARAVSEPNRDAARYVIRRELARGGMGRVSIAYDTLLDRTVALKELLVPEPALAARFARELALTSRLEHPSIISIHDAGTWPGGDPFHVMRLVSGEPLDSVIARQDDVVARIALLPHGIAIVDALAYAHSQGIIHRDLKPANILVGEFGETVVLDWGLAKDLRNPVEGESATVVPTDPNELIDTIAGLVIGTPAYMAPEQARGEAVDERADVYALGAVLYHMLGGVAPHTGTSASEIVRAVAATTPPPLEERASGIPSDLLTIVGKALARRPEERYPTATELANDLRRFQSGQLVGAHRYTPWHLVKRWVHKYRTAVMVAAVATIVLAGVGVVSVHRVVSEQRGAARNRTDADELMTFMLTDLHDKLKPIGKLDLLGNVAGKARAYYRVHVDDQRTSAINNRVTALANLGEVLNAQGDPKGASSAYRDALALAEQLAEREPTKVAWQSLIARTHGRAGAVLFDQRDAAGALVEFHASLAIDRRLAEREPDAAGVNLDLTFDRLAIGDVLDAQNDLDGALVEYRAGLAIAARFASLDPGTTTWQELVTRSHGDIGGLLMKRGDKAGALVEDTAALAASEQLIAHDPQNGDWQVNAVNQHIQIGAVLEDHDAVTALVHFRAALAISERLVERDPSNEIWQRAVSMSRTQVGDLLLQQGDAPHALEQFRAAVAGEQTLATVAPANLAIQRELAAGEGHLGEVLLANGDSKGALVEFRAGLANVETIAARDPTNASSQRDLATARNNVASALFAQGANAPALEQFRSAAAISQRLFSTNPTNIDVAHELAIETMSVGDTLAAQQDPTAAVVEYRAAAELATKLLATRPADQTALGTLFDSHTKVADLLGGAEAITEYRAAVAAATTLATQEPANPAFQEALADSLAKLGELLRAARQEPAALDTYRAALAVAEHAALADPKVWTRKVAALHRKLAAR